MTGQLMRPGTHVNRMLAANSSHQSTGKLYIINGNPNRELKCSAFISIITITLISKSYRID
jgi:hypothetical protein